MAGVVDLEMAWQLNVGMGAVILFLGGKPSTFPQRYATASPVDHLPLGIPQILIHGTEDRVVPVSVSQAYVQKANEAGDHVRLIELEAVDHVALIDPTTAAWEVARLELQKLLEA